MVIGVVLPPPPVRVLIFAAHRVQYYHWSSRSFRNETDIVSHAGHLLQRATVDVLSCLSATALGPLAYFNKKTVL